MIPVIDVDTPQLLHNEDMYMKVLHKKITPFVDFKVQIEAVY